MKNAYKLDHIWSPSELERAARLLGLQFMPRENVRRLTRYWIREFADLPLSKDELKALAEDDDGGE